MFVAPSIYSTRVYFVDLQDKDFFEASHQKAIDLFKSGKLKEIDKKVLKSSTPVIFNSNFSKQLDEETIVSRKDVNSERARRKFIMIDADFDAGQEEESINLRQKLKELADHYNTWLYIYPTASYPEKPRFRAVMFVKRVLNYQSYHQAMSWLYDSLEMEALDPSDFRMSANRNCPVFSKQEQIDDCVLIFDDDRKPLDNALWKEYPKPQKSKTLNDNYRAFKSQFPDITYNSRQLIKGAKEMSMQKIAQSYSSFWRIVESIAASFIFGEINEETAKAMLKELSFASSDTQTQERWAKENVELFNKHVNILSGDKTKAIEARPLALYTEFQRAMRINTDGEEEK